MTNIRSFLRCTSPCFAMLKQGTVVRVNSELVGKIHKFVKLRLQFNFWLAKNSGIQNILQTVSYFNLTMETIQTLKQLDQLLVQ